MQRTYILPVNNDDGQWLLAGILSASPERADAGTLAGKAEKPLHGRARSKCASKAGRQLAQARFNYRFDWTSQGTRLSRLTCHNTKKGEGDGVFGKGEPKPCNPPLHPRKPGFSQTPRRVRFFVFTLLSLVYVRTTSSSSITVTKVAYSANIIGPKANENGNW